MTKIFILNQIPGGSDLGWDGTIPTDAASYSASPTAEGRRSLSDIRAGLYAQYQAAGNPRDLATLGATALTPANSAGDGDALEAGRTWSMSPQMPKMAALFNSGNMAIVPDVGPLLEPTDKASILNGTANLPDHLRAHDHQQDWLASLGTRGKSATGIGGRIADLVAEKKGLDPAHAKYSRISFTSSLFTTGADNSAFKLTQSGEVTQLSALASRGASTIRSHSNSGGLDNFTNMLRGPNGVETTVDFFTPNCAIEEALWNKRKTLGIDGEVVADLLDEDSSYTPPDLSEADAGRFYSNIFPAIAKLIHNRNSTSVLPGGLDHIIIHVFGGMAGTDSHDRQAEDTPVGQRWLDNFTDAIYQVSAAEGAEDEVVQYIASEFGRTIVPNPTGTDHAWACPHFIIGGSGVMVLSGGRFVGGTPTSPVFNPADPDWEDPAVPGIVSSRGDVLPQNATEQALGCMGSFLGLTADEITNGINGVPGAVPNLGAFAATPTLALLPIFAPVT